MATEWSKFLDKACGMVGGSVLGRRELPCEEDRERYAYTAISVIMPVLNTINECGINFSPKDIVEHYMAENNIYSEECAYMRSNYELGLIPPFTGIYANPFKDNFAGVLRAGYWGTIMPANPEGALELCKRCGCIEMGREAFECEKYFTAMASLAHSSQNSRRTMKELVVKSTNYIEKDSAAAEVVAKTLEYCEEKKNMLYVVKMLERDYGAPNIKDFRMNLGVTTAALLLGNGNTEDTLTAIKSANSGYPEYCGSMAGEILGIIEGYGNIEAKYRVSTVKYDKDDPFDEKAKRVFEIGMEVAFNSLMVPAKKRKVKFANEPSPNVAEKKKDSKIYYTVEYENDNPEIRPGERKKIRFVLNRTEDVKAVGHVRFLLPEGFKGGAESLDFRTGFMPVNPEITVTMSKELPIIMKKNIAKVQIMYKNGETEEETFGIPGASLMSAFGPFKESYADKKETSGKMQLGEKEKTYADYYGKIYSGSADMDKEYLEEQLLANKTLSAELVENPLYMRKNVYITGNCIKTEDFFGGRGPCVIYVEWNVYTEKERNIRVEVGCSGGFKLWKDGELLAWSEGEEYYTPKNIIRNDITLKKNENKFLVKILRTNENADFSITLFDDLTGKRDSDILTDIGCYR